jgi:hypothetical protein
MRIFGGNDYYDSAMGYGHDAQTVFVRGDALVPARDMAKIGLRTAVMEGYLVDAKRPPRRRWEYGLRRWRRGGIVIRAWEYQVEPVTVVVAGTRYNGVHVRRDPVGRPGSAEADVLWDAEAFMRWQQQCGVLFEAAPVCDMDEYFEPAPLPAVVLNRVMERRWTILAHSPGDPEPVNSRDESPWRIDQPVLKDLKFFRRLPANLLFQEIDVWLGGRLGIEGRPMAEVSDAVRLAKHGMDHTSFRRPKQKKSPKSSPP